jgi:hypothetical protein
MCHPGCASSARYGIGPGAAARHVEGRGTSPASSASRVAGGLAGLAGLDLGAARHRAGIEGLAAERSTGIGPGAAARRVEGRGTSPASSGRTDKWRPSDPTSAHWYDAARLERLMAAHIARDQDRGRDPRMVREFIGE